MLLSLLNLFLPNTPATLRRSEWSSAQSYCQTAIWRNCKNLEKTRYAWCSVSCSCLWMLGKGYEWYRKETSEVEHYERNPRWGHCKWFDQEVRALYYDASLQPFAINWTYTVLILATGFRTNWMVSIPGWTIPWIPAAPYNARLHLMDLLRSS